MSQVKSGDLVSVAARKQGFEPAAAVVIADHQPVKKVYSLPEKPRVPRNLTRVFRELTSWHVGCNTCPA